MKKTGLGVRLFTILYIYPATVIILYLTSLYLGERVTSCLPGYSLTSILALVVYVGYPTWLSVSVIAALIIGVLFYGVAKTILLISSMFVALGGGVGLFDYKEYYVHFTNGLITAYNLGWITNQFLVEVGVPLALGSAVILVSKGDASIVQIIEPYYYFESTEPSTTADS